MGQCRYFDRNIECRKFFIDVITPSTGTLQSLPESIFESLLKPDSTHGITQGLVCDV